MLKPESLTNRIRNLCVSDKEVRHATRKGEGTALHQRVSVQEVMKLIYLAHLSSFYASLVLYNQRRVGLPYGKYSMLLKFALQVRSPAHPGWPGYDGSGDCGAGARCRCRTSSGWWRWSHRRGGTRHQVALP